MPTVNFGAQTPTLGQGVSALNDVSSIAGAIQNPTVGSGIKAAVGAANLYNTGAQDVGGTPLPSDVTGALGAGAAGAGDILGIVNAINNPDNPGADAAAAVDIYGLGTATAAAASAAAGTGLAAFSSALSSTGPYGAIAAVAADVLANNVNLAGIHPGSSGSGMSAEEEQALGLTQGTLNGQGDISSNGIAYEYGNQTTSGSDSFHVYDPTTGTYGASVGVPQSNTIVDMAKSADTYAQLAGGPDSQILTPQGQAIESGDPDWSTNASEEAAVANDTVDANQYYQGLLTQALAGLNQSYGSASQWGGASQSDWDTTMMNLAGNITLPTGKP